MSGSTKVAVARVAANWRDAFRRSPGYRCRLRVYVADHLWDSSSPAPALCRALVKAGDAATLDCSAADDAHVALAGELARTILEGE